MARYAQIIGWGKYLPQKVLTNQDLERLVDTPDAWIVSRTGIRERRIALCEAVEEGRLKDGDHLVLVGFGGGLS